MEFIVARLWKTDDTTTSVITANSRFFGYTLEDVVRAKGVKIPGKTAIPSGRYEVVISMSNRFKRRMPELLNVENFSGIRCHGGNTHLDTEGCLLVARNHPTERTIQGSLESEMTRMIEEDMAKGIKSYITILDCLK